LGQIAEFATGWETDQVLSNNITFCLTVVSTLAQMQRKRLRYRKVRPKIPKRRIMIG
jgi:hypothetical protein